jgi:hypothetical protein
MSRSRQLEGCDPSLHCGGAPNHDEGGTRILRRACRWSIRKKKMAQELGGDVNILATDFQVVIRWSHTVNNVSEKKTLCHVVVSMRSASYRFQCNVRGVVVK